MVILALTLLCGALASLAAYGVSTIIGAADKVTDVFAAIVIICGMAAAITGIIAFILKEVIT